MTDSEEEWRGLPNGMDYLIRPVSAGLLSFESLREKRLTLEDILILNVFLDNQTYNRELMARKQEAQYGKRH